MTHMIDMGRLIELVSKSLVHPPHSNRSLLCYLISIGRENAKQWWEDPTIRPRPVYLEATSGVQSLRNVVISTQVR